MVTTAEYNAYTTHQTPEHNPWTVQYLEDMLKGIGVVEPQVSSYEAGMLEAAYDQATRYYHGPKHGVFMGQKDVPPVLAARLSNRMSADAAGSSMALAGLFHDVAYKHVDEWDDEGTHAWPLLVETSIGDVANFSRFIEYDKPVFRTHLTPEGQQDTLVRMVADIFEVPESGIIHNQGGNEFDSALAAARFLQSKGASTKAIITVVAQIAATIPFRPAKGVDEQGRMTDGHMGELAQRVHRALVETGSTEEQFAWQDTNDIMLLSVQLANRDIAPFAWPDNFADFIHNGRGVRAEEIRELRDSPRTIRRLARAAGLESAARIYGWFRYGDGFLKAEDVYHFYIPRDEHGIMQSEDMAYPPLPIYDQAIEHTHTNARLGHEYFVAHELGILLAASIATKIGEPDAVVPGIVDAAQVPLDTVAPALASRSADEHKVHRALQIGEGQEHLGKAMPRRSPIAAVIYGQIGTEGVTELSAMVQQIRDDAKKARTKDPFSNSTIVQPYGTTIAEHYIKTVRDRIGEDAFRVITSMLYAIALKSQDDPVCRVKPGRAERLLALSATR
jgi:hypothetical protein